MVRTRQQEFRTSIPVHKPSQGPTQNNHLSTIEEETQQLTHVEENVDVLRATMERMEAAMMHLTQCVNSRAPQKPKAQPGTSNRHGMHKSQQINEQHRQRARRSP